MRKYDLGAIEKLQNGTSIIENNEAALSYSQVKVKRDQSMPTYRNSKGYKEIVVED